MNKLKLIIIMLCIFILSACSAGSSSVKNQSTLNGSIRIGHVNAIPYSQILGDYVLLPVQNDTNQIFYLNSIKLIQNNLTLSTDKYLDINNCNRIRAGQTCYLKLFTHKHSGYLINIIYQSSASYKIELKQMVNFIDNLADHQKIVMPKNDNWVNSISGLTIPVLINRPYHTMEVSINNADIPVICSHPNNSSHNMCSIIISPTDHLKDRNLLTIRLYDNKSTLIASDTMNINMINNLNANIISSALNPTINPADGSNPVLVTLFNNGTALANSLVISGVTPINIENNTCGSSLNVSQSCVFAVDTSSSLSGQSSAIVSYNNSTGSKIIPINVSYISTLPSPLVSLTPNGNFTNVAINQGSIYLTVNVKNTGNTSLQNLQFNNLSLANLAMNSFVFGSTCTNGQDLAIGASCKMIVSYRPTVVQSGNVSFIVTANYYNQTGQLQTYSNSNLVIPYSSVSGAIFKAVGDFGIVVSSPAGVAGTWTANVDSPFATTAISANSMFVNNNTYLMTMSNGLIKYSNLNGLFWKTSSLGSSGGLNASSCSIAYDANYYYTCGTVSVAFSSICTTTGRGCIIRTNNLGGGWTPLFRPTQAVAINDLFYFNNGSNAAYVGAVANTNSNSGLVTSVNGTTWLATSSGQTGSANNNFTPVVFNPSTNNLTSWNSVGWSSTEPISTVSTTWVPNTSTRPSSGIKVTSGLFRSGTYILTLANGNIYSATSPTGTYTQNSVNTTQLNRIIYASNVGSGTYFAVGNSGVNLVATSPTGPWVAQTALRTGQSTLPNLTGAYYDNSNIWVTGVSTILKSTNAINWITPALLSITKNVSSYLAVDNQGNIYSSNDAINWITQTNPTSNVINSIYCARQNLCFAVGNNGTILKSTDGVSWYQLVSGTANNLYGITCNNDICIAVGGGGTTNTGTILYTNDYNSWSVISNSLSTPRLNSIAYYNNSYIAVGNAGTVFSSTNGMNWQSMTSGTSVNLNSIICANNSGCVAVGNTGTILFSAFGTAWSSATSGTTNDLMSVAYNGIFVTVGKGGVLRYSSTGTGTWSSAVFPSTSSATNNLNAVISD